MSSKATLEQLLKESGITAVRIDNCLYLDRSFEKVEDIIRRTTERRVAMEILDIIELVSFSDKYMEYRINYGSRGQRDLIINMIKERYLGKENEP